MELDVATSVSFGALIEQIGAAVRWPCDLPNCGLTERIAAATVIPASQVPVPD